MAIYLFRDETDSDVFAFSVDAEAMNIPPITPLTEWVFLEAIHTLKFPAPWDIGDFQYVLDHLKTHKHYFFRGEIIGPTRDRSRTL